MKIKSEYERETKAYVVSMPDYVSLEALELWGQKFKKELNRRLSPKPEALLLDTNKHNFESFECLKLLRSILNTVVSLKNGINRIAFVQPEKYRISEIISYKEAYFSNNEDARKWLKLVKSE